MELREQNGQARPDDAATDDQCEGGAGGNLLMHAKYL